MKGSEPSQKTEHSRIKATQKKMYVYNLCTKYASFKEDIIIQFLLLIC